MSVDLPGQFYWLPPSFQDVLYRPDLVAWNDSKKRVYLFELTVPYEKNVTAAATRKEEKHRHLRDMFSKTGWSTKFCPLQLGSRGLLDMKSLGAVETFAFHGQKRMPFIQLLHRLCRISIGCSHAVWCCRNKSSWETRPLFH